MSLLREYLEDTFPQSWLHAVEASELPVWCQEPDEDEPYEGSWPNESGN